MCIGTIRRQSRRRARRPRTYRRRRSRDPRRAMIVIGLSAAHRDGGRRRFWILTAVLLVAAIFRPAQQGGPQLASSSAKRRRSGSGGGDGRVQDVESSVAKGWWSSAHSRTCELARWRSASAVLTRVGLACCGACAPAGSSTGHGCSTPRSGSAAGSGLHPLAACRHGRRPTFARWRPTGTNRHAGASSWTPGMPTRASGHELGRRVRRIGLTLG